MTVLEILKLIAAGLTVVTGLVSLIFPRSTTGFTGLAPTGPRGISEIRSVLGGLFIGLGAVPLILGSSETYLMLGVGYLAIAVVRAVSIVVDKAPVSSNLISLVVEIAFGVVLVI